MTIDGLDGDDRLFYGSGDVPVLCRAIDWRNTALGDVADWPASVRTLVRMCLDAATVPMALWVGPDLTLLYNQTYADLLGAPAHPVSLGRPARELSSESWAQIEPSLRRAMDGECVQFQGALLPPAHGAPREPLRVSHSFVPVRDDGAVVAVFDLVNTARSRAAEPAQRSTRAVRQEERLDFEMHGTTSAQPAVERHCSEHWAPVKDRAGAIIGISVAAEEITEKKRAARALAESEERFRTLADNIPQLAWMADHTGAIFWYNRQWYEYTGASFEEVQGWGWTKAHHPSHAARVVRKISHCFATGELWEDTFPLRSRTGEYRWFLSRATPIRDAAGNIARWLGTNTDITEMLEVEEALRASEARLQQLADAMPQIVWMARADGHIHYINERISELSGVRRLEDGTWTWGDTLVPEDRNATVEAWTDAVRTGTPYEIAHRLRRADGSVHWYLSRAEAVRDDHNRIVQWFGTATDIETQKRAEHAVREADRNKTDFLAWLSHELRNPIGIIHTALALIDRAGLTTEQGHRALPIIKRQVTQIDRLLQDLLDIARIAKGKILLRRESVSLNEIVETAGEDHREMFERDDIAFDVTVAPQVLRASVDRARMAQAVGNLLQNAAKFTPSGGRVVLSLDAAGDDTAVIEVRDTGPGVAPEMLAKVFEPLVQDLRTIHRNRGGLGLGLALVKELVSLHGGTVGASRAVPDGGAVFTIRLPLESAAASI